MRIFDVTLIALGIFFWKICSICREDDESDEGEVAAEPPPASSSSPAGNTTFEFDVFLNFRGADTRNSFTGSLYHILKLHDITTFIDNKDLHKGERIGKLFEYIERSKVCIAIISKGYADSKWCLREITKMVELGKRIIPVFFNIEPSDVRNQRGPFAAAFKEHAANGKITKEEVRKWRDALKKVGDIAGYNLKDTAG